MTCVRGYEHGGRIRASNASTGRGMTSGTAAVAERRLCERCGGKAKRNPDEKDPGRGTNHLQPDIFHFLSPAPLQEILPGIFNVS
jgi:hypothetical protein